MKKQHTLVQYPYAQNEQGYLTHISEAQHSHSYTCPGCKNPLIPVLGEFKAKHFRHYEEHCSFETYLHHCAKKAFFYRYRQALKSSKPIRLELVRTVYCNSDRLKLLRTQEVQCQKKVPACYDLTKIFSQAELEQHDSSTGLKPDILLSDSSGNRRCG
ncbi:hypothetical protein [Endozoicomonas sp.]|uniref:competence protein CoiA family protein n=1 Tax=Endozoicomonas sp. TaxID=1892382 RepID=UPI003D9BD55B